MEDVKESFENLAGKVKDYIETRKNILVMDASEKTSKVVSGIITGLVAMVLSLFFIIFISFALAYGIGEMVGKMYVGFLVVAAIYLLMGVILFAARKRFIQQPLMLMLVNLFSNEEDNN